MAQPWELDWSKAGGKPQDESALPWERPWGAPVAEKKPDDAGNASRGFKEAFQQLPQLGYGLLAGTGAALESAVGEGGIATGIKKAGVRGYQEWGDKIAAQSKDTDSWNYAWDAAKQGDIGALGAWLAHGLGYAGGQAVQMLATAGIGAVAGKATLGTVASSLAEGMVKKEAAALAATGAAKGLTTEQLTAVATKNVASRIGQTAAIGASAFGMEGGEIFGDLTQEATKEGRVLSGGELAKAFGATLAAGGLEFVGDKVGLDILLGKSRLLKPAEGMAGIGGRAARGGIAAAGAAPIEGATEYGQTLLEEFGKGKDPFSEESRAHAVDAAALGALGGAAMGGVGGAIRGPQKKLSASDVLAADSVEDAAKTALLAISGPAVKADWEVVDGVRALPGPSIPEPAGMLRSLPGPGSSVYMVDSQGNAAVQPAAVRADAISRATEAAVQADAAAAELAALGKQTPRGAAPAAPGMAPIPVGEATEVPAIPTGDATELEPIPVGEVSELLPTGEASELPRRIPVGRATELPVETIRADDLLTSDGVPYGSKTAANVRAKKEGLNQDAVVEIPGAGGVVRPAATDGAVDGADTARVAGQRAVDGTRGDGTQRLPDQRPGDVPAGAGMAAPQNGTGAGPAGLGDEQPAALKPGDSVKVGGKTWTVSAVQPDRLVIDSADGVKRMVAAGSRTWNEIQAASTAPTPEAEQQQEGQTYEVTTRQGTTFDAGAEVAPVIKPAGELPKRTEARGTARHPATVMGSRLLATVSQGLGGLDPAWLGEFSTRRETRRIGRDGRPIVQWANPLIPGVGKLFRRGGTQDLQLLAEALERAGYLEPGSVEADAKDAGERAKAMIRQALEKAEPQTMDERQAEAEAELLARQQQYDAAEDAGDYPGLDPESAAEAEAEREAIMAEAGLSVAEMAAVQDDDIDLFSDKPAMPQDEAMRALGFTEQEIADELARQKASADRAAGRGAEEARQDGPGQARAPAEAGSTEAGQGSEGAGEGLTVSGAASAPATTAQRDNLGRVMRRAGWEIDYVDIDLTGGSPKVDIKVHRDDGRWLFAKLDAQGRASFETFQRDRRLGIDPKNPQARLSPQVDDQFLGRQKFAGVRAMLRGMTNYLVDNAAGDVSIADMRAAWGSLLSGGASISKDTPLLTTQTAEDLKAKTDREEAARRAEKSAHDAEQARLKKADEDRDNRARADKTVNDFQLGQSAEQQMSGMGDLFAAPATAPAVAQQSDRYEAGRALTKEQRKQVLGTLVDVYKAKGAPREMKGQGRDGNERYGYAHSPELFEKSDITGAMVRYYVTLPDGRRAHPSELFPGYTQADIDAAMSKQEADERNDRDNQVRAESQADKFAMPTAAEAEASWRQRNSGPNALQDWRTGRTYTLVQMQKGGRFYAVRNDDAALMERLERAGWRQGDAASSPEPAPAPARAQPAITPDQAANMQRGDIVRDGSGTEYYAWSARFGRLDVVPLKDGKPVVHSGSTVRFALDDATKGANPEYRADALYLVRKAQPEASAQPAQKAEAKPAEPTQAATAILDAANITGKERLDALKDVKAGAVTPEELAAAYPPAEAQETTDAQRRQAADHAKDLGGRVVWQRGDLALIEGYSLLSGDSVYIAANGSQRTRVDIQSYTGKGYTEAQKAELMKARADAVRAADELLARSPDGPFADAPLVFADDIPASVQGVVRGWIGLLGLDSARIVVTTPASGAAMADGMAGKFRRIGKASLSGDNTNGVMQPLGGDDFHIAVRPSASTVKALEVLAHELGHIVERRAFAQADAGTQQAIRESHAEWLKENGSGRALDMAQAMRAYRSGQTTGFSADAKATEAGAYWRSFGEWFADQVSRWATTQDRPVDVVEKFFKRLADRLRGFFTGERTKFKPNTMVAQWLDSLAKDIPPSDEVAATYPVSESAQDPGAQALDSDSIPFGPAGDAMLRALPLETKEQAAAFLSSYQAWIKANNPYGMVLPKNHKPAVVRAPDLVQKARTAADLAEANYWQMPYEEAIKRAEFYGLPRAKWEAERRKRGIDAASPMPEVGRIPMSLAQQAHAGTSFAPERRAEQERDSFKAALQDAWERAARIAGADQAAIARITEVFQDVADGYRARYVATLQAKSRVMSAMIAGPARFPTERNRKRIETEMKRAEEASAYLDRGIKRLLRAARGPIDNSPASELERVRLNLSQREELQETMKAANAALRKDDDAALEDLGFTPEQIADLKKGSKWDRGFPSYRLTNNNAEIRRLRERLADAEARVAAAESGPVESERQGVRIVEDATDDRIRLIFDGKPSEEVRNDLKAAAFKWSPKNEAWQRQLTPNAKRAAQEIIDKHFPAGPKPSATDEAPKFSRASDTIPLDQSDAIGREFWRKIDSGETFTEQEVLDALATNRRGAVRKAQSLGGPTEFSRTGQAAIGWQGDLAGFGAYTSRAMWEDDHFSVFFIPDKLAAGADLNDPVQARDRALVHVSFVPAGDGRYTVSLNDPPPQSTAESAAANEGVAAKAGRINNPYTRIDLSAGDVTSRTVLQEAVRRLALNIGFTPSIGYEARDTGARANLDDTGRGHSEQRLRDKFSRSVDGARGVPMPDAKALVAAIRESLPTAPPIVVHESVDQAPDALRKAIEDAGAYNDVEAAYHDGEIHVFPANIASVERMEFVVAHHEVRHHGLRTMLGRRMGPLMLRLYADNASLRAAADKKLSDGLADTRILAVEEALADLPVSELTALKSWDRIVAAIRQWLRDVAAKLRRTMPNLAEAIEPSRWTDRDIAALVQRAENISRGGTAVYPTRGTVFSRDDAATAETAAGRMAEALRGLGDTKLPGDYIAADFISSHGKLSWWDKTVGSMHNLAQRNPLFKPVYDRAQQFLNAVSSFATEAADLAPNLLPKLEGLRDLAKTPLSADDTKAIAAPIFEGTLMWTRDEDGKVVREEDPGKAGLVWTDAELRSRFDLNDKQIGLYREFRKATNKSLTDLTVTDMIRFGGADVEAVADEALASGDVRRAADMLVRHLHDMADSESDRAGVLLDTASRIVDKADRAVLLMSRGYAPLMRFGHYTLDVVDADGDRVYFGLFESQAEANRFARKMREAYPDATIERGTRSEEAYKMFAGVSPETLELFGEMLGLEPQGDDAASQAFQEYLKLSKSNRSAMKRLIERKGVAGFSEDAGRVLAGFVYSNARQSSKNLHMRHLGRAVQDIAKQKGKGELMDAAVRLQQYVSNPVEEAQKIRGLMFTQFLGGSIAAGMVNLSQVPMVTFPYLSQFGGARQAAAEMKRALSDALRWDTAKTEAQRTTGDRELDAALRRAEEDGTVSPQEVHNLIAQAGGSGALRAGDGTTAGDLAAKGSNFMSKLMLVWGRPFAIAEQFNRRATFIAAYRVAVANGMDNPAEFAEQAVTETQFNYTKANRPEWARGAIGSVLFTFKTYSISYVELLSRLAKSGPEGRKAAVLALGVMFLMSGLQGIPGADDLDDLIDGLLQRLGYNFSSKMAKREFFAKYMGETGAGFMMRGVSGIPGVPIDVAGRLGLGNLIPGTGLLTKKADHTQDVTELLGPAGSFAKQVFTAADQATQGNLGEAVRAVLPVAAQNAWKGYEMATSGTYRDMRDRKVIDTDAYDAMVKAIGFQPSGVAKVQDSTRQVQQFIALNKMRETEIADQWAKAIFEGDEDGKAEARAALEQWNRDNPESPIRITTAQLLKRLRAMREDKVSRIERTAPKEIRNEVKRELSAAL